MAGIFRVFEILQAIFIWSTLVIAVVVIIALLPKIRSRSMRLKEWIIISIAGLYAIAFVILRIFFTGVFEGIAGVAFWLILVISIQLTKHEDRVAGRRWWRD